MPRRNYQLVSNHPLATNTNVNNNSFMMQLKTPLQIPNNAKNIVLYCQYANIVNFFYNISTALGNNILYFTDNIALPEKYTITLPDGAYDFTNVNDYLKQYFLTNGYDANTIKFYAQEYTGKVSVAVTQNFGVKIPAGMGVILGYNANSTYFNNTLIATTYYDAPNIANFNSIISLNLNCDLARSSYYNGEDSTLLASVGITSKVGSLIHYAPTLPIKIDCPNYAGLHIDRITLTVLDQLNRTIKVAENWNATLVFEWDE